MFSDLPKIFDRNFFVGYLLPVLGFIFASIPVFLGLPAATIFLGFLKANIVAGTSIIAIFAWLSAMLLLATNRPIIRAKEGYGLFNPANLWAYMERARFDRLYREIDSIEQSYGAAQDGKGKISPKLTQKRRRLACQKAERFPESREHLLPTAFGNVVRAFEVYPLIMYGLDGVSGWDRLIAVMPKDYREVVDTAKAQVDFWINAWFLALVFVAEHIVLDFKHGQDIAVLSLGLFVAWLSSRRARIAACDWGATVRSAFDVFLPVLRDALRLPVPQSRADEYKIWSTFSQAVTYRSVESLPDLHTIDKTS